jgi:hypothetical protein
VDIFEGLVRRLDEVEIDLFAGIAHQVWLRRNQWVFMGKFFSPVQVLQRALDQMEASNAALFLAGQHVNQPQRTSCPRSPRLQRWSLPQAHVLKCNWDAALDVGRKLMGIGILVRDHEGTVVAAKCFTHTHVTNSLTAEIIAAWTSARFIIQRG